MTGAIIMMVIGSVLLLPMAFLIILAFNKAVGIVIRDLLDYPSDAQVAVAIVILTAIGTVLLWTGIEILPK